MNHVQVSVYVLLAIGSGRGISPLPSHRTVRETLTSHCLPRLLRGLFMFLSL